MFHHSPQIYEIMMWQRNVAITGKYNNLIQGLLRIDKVAQMLTIV